MLSNYTGKAMNVFETDNGTESAYEDEAEDDIEVF